MARGPSPLEATWEGVPAGTNRLQVWVESDAAPGAAVVAGPQAYEGAVEVDYRSAPA